MRRLSSRACCLPSSRPCRGSRCGASGQAVRAWRWAATSTTCSPSARGRGGRWWATCAARGGSSCGHVTGALHGPLDHAVRHRPGGRPVAVNQSLLPAGTSVSAPRSRPRSTSREARTTSRWRAPVTFPMQVSARGVESIDCRGTLLGVFEDASFTEVELDLGSDEVAGLLHGWHHRGSRRARQPAAGERPRESLEANAGGGAVELADAALQAAVEQPRTAPWTTTSPSSSSAGPEQAQFCPCWAAGAR